MSQGSRSGLLWLGISILVLSCGGTVVSPDDDAGTGSGAGGSSGTGVAGTGGSVAGTGGYAGGTGGGTGGTGGQIVGGSGGAPAGAGGGVAGTGGGVPTCPPAPSCNWCSGSPRYDGAGCVVGYVCPNGVDPCSTPPCYTDADCATGVCKDYLCWGGAVACSPGECMGAGGGGASTCSCKWSCSDGNTYSFDCTSQGGGLSCTCYKNGYSSMGCGTAGGAGGAPDACDSCCGSPQ